MKMCVTYFFDRLYRIKSHILLRNLPTICVYRRVCVRAGIIATACRFSGTGRFQWCVLPEFRRGTGPGGNRSLARSTRSHRAWPNGRRESVFRKRWDAAVVRSRKYKKQNLHKHETSRNFLKVFPKSQLIKQKEKAWWMGTLVVIITQLNTQCV